MILGVPLERAALARAGHRRRRRHYRIARRPVRHRRRRGHRAGALRGVPHPRCARRGAHAALRRHLARDHPADHDPVLSHPSRQGAGGSRSAAAVGAPGGARRRLRCGDRVFRAGCRVQDCLRGDRNFHRDEISVCRRPLESRYRAARPGADAALRLHHRAHQLADGGERRLALQHRFDALRQDRFTRRSRPRRGSACRSPSSARSAISWPACTTARYCRRCRSALSR